MLIFGGMNGEVKVKVSVKGRRTDGVRDWGSGIGGLGLGRNIEFRISNTEY